MSVTPCNRYIRRFVYRREIVRYEYFWKSELLLYYIGIIIYVYVEQVGDLIVYVGDLIVSERSKGRDARIHCWRHYCNSGIMEGHMIGYMM